MTSLTTADREGLGAMLSRQRAAFSRDGPPALTERRASLMELKDALLAHRDDFVTALNADFGHRSRQETLLLELGTVVSAIKYLHRNLARWMRPERRRVAMSFRPASTQVIFQPLGVVGIISPWNYPVALALTPLATALAAGNRVMLKPSESMPATAELLASTLAEAFQENQVAVVAGDAKLGSAFASLPFDHILFTGSILVGRSVLRAASENLVRVTLELGGKSPVIIERGFSLRTAARRIAYGKLANAGQTCVAPDYALVAEEEIDDFVAAYKAEVEKLYPDIATNPDYTWVVNDRHFARLSGLLEDARANGARVIEIGPTLARRATSLLRMFTPTLVLDVTDEMNVMTQEIFGPTCQFCPMATSKTRLPLSMLDLGRWHSISLALMFRGASLCSTARRPGTLGSTRPFYITLRTISRSAALAKAAWGRITATKGSRP